MKEQIEEKHALSESIYMSGHGLDWKDSDDIAEQLYTEGYRKQSEGVWIYNPDGIDWGLGAWQCSLCSCNNHNLPQDKDTNPLIWAGGKYCPNCGAKMKGGAE